MSGKTIKEQTGKGGGVAPMETAAQGGSWNLQHHDWIVEQLHHLSRDLGKLEEKVNGVYSDVEKIKGSLHRMELIIALATGAIIVIGFILDKEFDKIFAILSAAHQ